MNEYVEKLKKDLGYPKSFDITFREVITPFHKYNIIFLNFLIKNESIINIIYSLNTYNSEEGVEYLSKVILNEASNTTNNYEEIYDAILNGMWNIVRTVLF